MKKIIIVFISLILALSLSLPVFATYANINDGAELVSSFNEATLERLCAEIRSKYDFDAVIVTVKSSSGMTARRYAESCYDNGGYGKDGILLFVDMDSREWYVCTSGSGKKLFSDPKIDSMMDTVLPSLAGGDYYSGFYSFLRSVDDTLYHDSLGNSAARNAGMKALFCVLIGFVISLIIVISQKKKLKTVRKQKNATAYMQSGSESITVRREKFLYSQVTKVAKPQSNSSGGHSSHGGHGGHF